jgi:hypothetical protein
VGEAKTMPGVEVSDRPRPIVFDTSGTLGEI